MSTRRIGAHQGYVVSYFSAKAAEVAPLTSEWGANHYWRGNGEPIVTAEAYETWPAPDFDLAPWIARGKLFWITPDDADWRLSDDLSDCPYLDLPGSKTHQHVQSGRVW